MPIKSSGGPRRDEYCRRHHQSVLFRGLEGLVRLDCDRTNRTRCRTTFPTMYLAVSIGPFDVPESVSMLEWSRAPQLQPSSVAVLEKVAYILFERALLEQNCGWPPRTNLLCAICQLHRTSASFVWLLVPILLQWLANSHQQ